jgi:hypothetical protein
MSDSLAVQGGNFFYRRTDAYKNVSPPHTPQHRHSQATRARGARTALAKVNKVMVEGWDGGRGG